MKQYDIVELFDAHVVILQDDGFDRTRSVIVAPFISVARQVPFPIVTPEVEWSGDSYIVNMFEMFAAYRRDLGSTVGTVETHRHAIIDALDRLLVGL